MKRSNVGSVMTSDVVRAEYGTPFKEVAQLLYEHRISGLPVVDADQSVMGVISETDVLARQAEAVDPYEPSRRFHLPPLGSATRRRRTKARAQTAEQLMSRPAMTVYAEATIAEAARTMAKHHVKRLPVIDAQEHLIGIVTRHDLLQVYLRTDQDIHSEVLDQIVHTLDQMPHAINITVRQGIVTLAGQLERRSDIKVAARMAQMVDGVVSVNDELTFRFDNSRVGIGEQKPRGVADDWLRKL